MSRVRAVKGRPGVLRGFYPRPLRRETRGLNAPPPPVRPLLRRDGRAFRRANKTMESPGRTVPGRLAGTRRTVVDNGRTALHGLEGGGGKAHNGEGDENDIRKYVTTLKSIRAVIAVVRPSSWAGAKRLSSNRNRFLCF